MAEKPSLKDRISYMWEYDKVYLLFGLVVIIIALMLWQDFGADSKEEALYGVIIGNPLGMEREEALQEEIGAYLDIDTEKETVLLDSTLTLALDENEVADETAQMNLAKLTAYISGGELDFIIGTEEVIRHYAGLSALKELDTYLPEEILADCGELLYMASDKEGRNICCAIRLERGSFVAEEPMYLSIVNSTGHETNVVKFVEFALQDEKAAE